MCEHTTPMIEKAEVLANERVTEGVGLLTLRAPQCARAIAPGQFVHLRISRNTPEILRRPFSVHRTADDVIQILFQVLGKGTRAMAELEPGDTGIDLVGPLGHGWEVPEGVRHALLVTGGLGAAPMGMLAEALAARGVATVVAMGAPTASRLVARELFEDTCRRVLVSTDDGSAGSPGYVVGVCRELLDTEQFDMVYTCGPEIMQRIVAEQAEQAGVDCQVSLERLMACGIGACLSCIVSTTAGQKRACVDGPVFSASEVIWDR